GLVANTCCRDRRVRAAVVMAGDRLDFPGGSYEPASNPPLLVIHGDSDPAVPYRAGVDAFAMARAPKGLVSIRRGDHGAPAGEGTLLNIVECSRNPPSGAGDCDLARASLFMAAGAEGTGSAAFTVHAGAIGSGVCDSAHPVCVVVVNEGGSSAPQDSVITPIG